MLRSFFPTLFDWFDTLPKVEGNPDTDLGDPADLPQWLLCTKLPGRSSGISIAAGVAFPTGSDIDFNVQTKRSGFRENILILSKYYITLFMVSSINVYNIHSATCTPIPSELLKQWQKCVGKKVEKKKLRHTHLLRHTATRIVTFLLLLLSSHIQLGLQRLPFQKGLPMQLQALALYIMTTWRSLKLKVHIFTVALGNC